MNESVRSNGEIFVCNPLLSEHVIREFRWLVCTRVAPAAATCDEVRYIGEKLIKWGYEWIEEREKAVGNCAAVCSVGSSSSDRRFKGALTIHYQPKVRILNTSRWDNNLKNINRMEDIRTLILHNNSTKLLTNCKKIQFVHFIIRKPFLFPHINNFFDFFLIHINFFRIFLQINFSLQNFLGFF